MLGRRLGMGEVIVCIALLQVQELVQLIHKRRSDRNEHAMDVLMDALKKQKVQAHIARELQRALARAKERRGIVCVCVCLCVLSPSPHCAVAILTGPKGKDGSLSPQTPSSAGKLHMFFPLWLLANL